MAVNLIDPSGNSASINDVVSQGTVISGTTSVTIQLRGQATASVQITASTNSTFVFEVYSDAAATWASVAAYPAAGGAAVTSVANTNGLWYVPVAGFYQFRCRCSAYVSGSPIVSIIASQGTQLPPVSAAGNAREDVVAWGGTALGTPTNFGTTPTAVIAGSVNASIFSGTTALGAPNTFGTTAPTGNALGVNASLFMGTTLARTNQATTASGVVDVNLVGSLGVTNSATNGSFFRLTDNTTAIAAAISALGTAPTGTAVQAVNNVALPNAAAGAACTLFQNSAVTTAVVVKASAGNVYGFMVNGGTSGNFLQFMNASATPTLGTNALVSIQIPASGIVLVPAADIAQFNAGTGISVGISTTYNGAAAGTAAAVVVLYK